MISIIIPTLNEELILDKTLASLQSNLSNIAHEIIVSDGGSKDRTQEIARRYGASVVTESDGHRQTIARGKNIGAAAATGDFLLFLDADVTVPDPDRFFRRALENFQKNPRLIGLTVRIRVLPERETIADRICFGGLGIFQAIMNNVLHSGNASGEFQMVRTAAFRESGGYCESIVASEDYEFFLRLSRLGRTYLDRQLVIFHTGRRPHTVGWPRLLLVWSLNGIWVFLFKRSFSREWKQIRTDS